MCNHCEGKLNGIDWDYIFKESAKFFEDEIKLKKEHPEMFHELLIITEKRDIAEIKRREKLGLFQPPKDELYTVNPNFDGKYSY